MISRAFANVVRALDNKSDVTFVLDDLANEIRSKLPVPFPVPDYEKILFTGRREEDFEPLKFYSHLIRDVDDKKIERKPVEDELLHRFSLSGSRFLIISDQ